MRLSVLTRSVVTIATLALGSAVFTVSPAMSATTSGAATSAGVTREAVLSLASGMRTGSQAAYPDLMKAARSILNRACAVDHDVEALLNVDEPQAVAAPSHADGVVLTGTARECVVGAVAATEPGFSLEGGLTLRAVTETTAPPMLQRSVSAAAVGPNTVPGALSGDVSTATLLVPQGEIVDDGNYSLTASGSAVKTTKVTTTTKVADKKTKAEKKRAKKTYAKRLKAAKKTYTKALRNAGSSSKKSAAKKAYASSKASAKARYRYAVADYRLVTRTTSSTDRRPFSIATPVY